MRFSKLENNFFSGRRGAMIDEAGPHAHKVYLYLWADGNSNYIGFSYVDFRQACPVLRQTKEEILGYIEKFEKAGFMKYDAKTQTLWIIDAAETNIGELKATDNNVIRAQKEFDSVPKECSLRQEFHAKYAAMLKLKDELKPVSAPVFLFNSAQAPAAPSDEDLRFEGVLEFLMMRRELNRKDFRDVVDPYVASMAKRLMAKHGRKATTQMMLDAIMTNDLNLNVATGRASEKLHLDDPEGLDIELL